MNTPRIEDPALRAQLVAWLEHHAQLWHSQGDYALSPEDSRRFHVVAEALVQMARDLEDEMRARNTVHRRRTDWTWNDKAH